MQAVRQSYFEYFGGTTRYWGDLGYFFVFVFVFLFLFFHLVSDNPNYKMSPKFFWLEKINIIIIIIKACRW